MFNLYVLAEAFPGRFKTPDGEIDFPALMAWLNTPEGRTAHEQIEALKEAAYPMPGRGEWGDEHPCALCGKYASTTVGGGAPVCREHQAWWNAEVERLRGSGTGIGDDE